MYMGQQDKATEVSQSKLSVEH
jgi:hypothetical protein